VVLVDFGRGRAWLSDKCYYCLEVVRVILCYYILCFFLLFGRIDSVIPTVEIGVCECNPDSFRDCPSAIVTCPLSLTWANASQYLDTESASPNPSP